ncbi:TPA: hypothetical protein DDZ86_01540 [Candidatus Dependentiae bacterium]|nr:hypothetical protein [Candidatus Dependentiae bacterium]
MPIGQENSSHSFIIYVSGGNTLKMMTLWRKQGIDTLLKRAHKSAERIE